MHPDNEPMTLEGSGLESLKAVNWDFPSGRGDDGIHGLLPYAAKFIPDIPKTLIELLTLQGDLVLDPFCGSGTTPLEAARAGRKYVGFDANAVAVATAQVKVRGLGQQEADQIRHLVARLATSLPVDATTPWQPDFPNRQKWYSDEVFDRLCRIRSLTVQELSGEAAEAALLVFAHAASRASFQESESRYVSKPRPIDPSDVQRDYAKALLRLTELAVRNESHSMGEIILGDARDASLYAPLASQVDLVVTSPPYPNAYDYHLYHRFRLYWLGHDPKELRGVEIGSHLTNQAKRDPIQQYETDIAEVVVNCAAALRPGAWMVWVVGDGLHEGAIYETSVHLSRIGEAAGLSHMATLTRNLPTSRRSVNHAGRRLEDEQLVIFRKGAIHGQRNYRLHGYERGLAERELAVLGTEQAVWAAFSHRVVLDGGAQVETHQARIEGIPGRTGSRKNSTYLGHGIHAYKGKFYPQLAKALMNISGVEQGQVVLDPFGGSGTVALEGTVRGLDAVSVDINPLAVEMARAKTGLLHVPEAVAKGSLRTIIDFEHRKLGRIQGKRDVFAALALEELESWFPSAVLDRMNWILSEGMELVDDRMAGVLRVLVSDIVRQCSQQDPGDLRIRRRKQPLEDAPVLALLAQRAADLEREMEHYWRWARTGMPKPGKARVIQGAIQDEAVARKVGEVDLVLSSPPYATALPYLDTDRLSLALVLGYDKKMRAALERELIGSREIARAEDDAVRAQVQGVEEELPLPLPVATFLKRYAHRVAQDGDAGFRKRQGPQVLARYLLRMQEAFGNVSTQLRSGSDMWIILGDSKTEIQGEWVPIPTIDLCAGIAEASGFELVERIPITVTREGVVHSRNSITENDILGFRRI